MDVQAFMELVKAHPELELVSVDAEREAVYLRRPPTGLCFSLTPRAILEYEWEEFEAVFSGRRPPNALSHMTRIVGYYSRVENWNKSKLSELADRRKGDYAPPDAVAASSPRPAAVAV